MMTFYHGNKRGTGARLSVEVRKASPCQRGEARLAIAPQADGEGPNGRYLFDTSNEVYITMDAVRTAKLVSMLNKDYPDEEYRFIRTKAAETRTTLFIDPVDEPFPGFALHLSHADEAGDYTMGDGRIVINNSEARALAMALAASLGDIAFGEGS